MEIKLDISGPKGNAFYIIGLVKELLSLVPAEDYADVDTLAELKEMSALEYIIEDMQSSDFEHLLQTFIDYFPFVKLISTRGKLDWVKNDDLYVVEEQTDIYL